METHKPFVIAIVGPTAIGKSEYAIRLAKQMGGEIISADSRQVYKGLDVGSGKVTKKEMRGVPHYLLDVVSPTKVFSAHDFKKKAEPILRNILARGKTPIVVGGTGFYIDALLGHRILPKVAPNKELRKTLEKMTAGELFKVLEEMDPARAKTIDAKNKVRLVRAIEIAKALGKVPELKTEELPYQTLWIGLTADRDVIQKKIAIRTRAQLKSGMVEELHKLKEESKVTWKRLHEMGLEQRLCAEYLKGNITQSELEKQLIEKTYQYAMRQLRWFKRNKQINWIDLQHMTKTPGDKIKQFLK